MIVDKPPGLVCEDARINALFPKYLGKLLLIHRLDKETSGALMIAKAAADKEAFVELFRTKSIIKIYEAIVDGKVEETDGKVQSYLVKKALVAGRAFGAQNVKAKSKNLRLLSGSV